MLDDPYLRGKWLAIIIWTILFGTAILTTIFPR